MAKKIQQLISFLGITTTIIITPSILFDNPAFAMNISLSSDNSTIQKYLSKELKSITTIHENLGLSIINSQNIECCNLNTKISSNNFEPMEIDDSSQVTTDTFGLPRIWSISAQEYLSIITQKAIAKKEDFTQIEVGEAFNNGNNNSDNIFSSIINSLKNIKTDGFKPRENVQIAVLPQVSANDIFKDMYEYGEVAQAQPDYNINTPLSIVLNGETKNNYGGGSSNPYVGLQQELVASVQVAGESSPQFSNFQVSANNRGFNSSLNSRPIMTNNYWNQYFDKGQLYSNPDGLVGNGVNPYVSQQLQLQKQSEQEIKQRMRFVSKTAPKIF